MVDAIQAASKILKTRGYSSNQAIDQTVLNRAKNIAIANNSGEEDPETIARNYELMEKLDTIIAGIDLPPILTSCAKGGITLSPKRLSDYALTSICTTGTSTAGSCNTWHSKYTDDRRKRFDIYLDAPCSISLTYKGLPNALIAFSLKDPKTLFVKQIQGVRPKVYVKNDAGVIQSTEGHSRGLMVLDFEKLLILLVEELAKDFGIEEIIIQSRKNNGWSTVKTERRGKERYDISARSLGYRRHLLDNRNWHKAIQPNKKEEKVQKTCWTKYIPFWSVFRAHA